MPPVAQPQVPVVDLPPATIPEYETYWQALGCMFHTGTETVERFLNEWIAATAPSRISADIETHGVGGRRFQITCVTFSMYDTQGMLHSVILNPLRSDRDRALVRRVFDHCGTVVFHNATFDIPILYAHRLITYEQIRKVEDTILLARMIRTNDKSFSRTLEALASRYGITADTSVKVEDAMKAAGFRNRTEGYESSDVDRPFYRIGAMSDTAATLRLWYELYERVKNLHTYAGPGSYANAKLTAEGAVELIDKIQRVSQITLQSSAVGLNWDPDYMNTWIANRAQKLEEAENLIGSTVSGYDGDGAPQYLSPGNGSQLIRFLHSSGELPDDWETTDKGALKADKRAMERLRTLGNPLAKAHTYIAEYHKNLTYLEQIREAAAATGRVHPATGILGAAASGRMSVKDPPLQQFSADARPIIIADEDDLWSVDWSSIEPVVLANCAGDAGFITPFNEGHDLYIPVARAAGLIPPEVDDVAAKDHKGRKNAKVILLAAMYGQGITSLAKQLDITVDEARALQDSIRMEMHDTFEFMRGVQNECRIYGASYTVMGRMLDERIATGEIVDRVAVNHFCQGSSADVLMEAILEIDRLGYGDKIRMLIHDEIVIDQSGLDACKQAMMTVPESLRRVARLTPKLKVDAQHMGRHWKKV